ncbi:hypothetical protein Btru_056398 [Bulinus truncatus]|nr:hypothetical protein Btru_056398 [Bulinus truncatus]
MDNENSVSDQEFCTAEDAWTHLHMRIKWTDPPSPGMAAVCMMSPLTIKLCIECQKPIPLRNFSALVWTHVNKHAEDRTSLQSAEGTSVTLSANRKLPLEKSEQYFKPLLDNPEGIYREIELKYVKDSRKWDHTGLTTYEFSTVVYPTSPGDFRLTYNVKYRCPDQGKVMVWANEHNEDSILHVNPPEPGNEWTKSISFSQIQDLVKWLWNVYPKYNKILIGDRDGIGHAGSAMTAYIFANNPNLTFEEAYRFVSSRRFIYCHKGLKEILMESYPRD